MAEASKRLSIASVLLLAFAALIVTALGALYVMNLRMLESSLTRELTDYARRHTASLEVLIQQDLISGFYPAVIQKTARFVDTETIPHIEIKLADGSVIYRGGELRPDLVEIQMPVLSNTSGLVDASAQREIARIHAWVSFARVTDQIRAQQNQALVMWAACLVITLAFVAFLSTWLTRPLRALTAMAATRDIEQVASYQPRSRFKELWRLEGELVALSQQVIKAGAAAKLNAQYAAVARTTQMLAHDVRKPFSLLKVGLESLTGERDGSKLRDAIDHLLPQVRRTMSTVNGMLTDIMELKPRQTIFVESVNVKALVAEAVKTAFVDKVGVSIKIDYQFRHEHDISADAMRMTRVLVNLIENAVQAMAGAGTMWIKASDETAKSGAKPMVKLVIGNSGSYIPPEEMTQLFTAFYTRHKAGGTGLGLTIADQIVRAHGGRIWCESTRERGTEFSILIPASGHIKASDEPQLPREIFRANIATQTPATTTTSADDRRPLVILVDDNPFFLDAWCRVMTDARAVTFTQPEAFLQTWAGSPELRAEVKAIILDFHYAMSEFDGAELARRLRGQTSAPIYLASDSDLTMTDAPDVTAIIGKQPRTYAELGD